MRSLRLFSCVLLVAAAPGLASATPQAPLTEHRRGFKIYSARLAAGVDTFLDDGTKVEDNTLAFVPMLGLGITLVASVIYVAVWEVNLSLTDYAFIEVYTQSVIADKQAAGVSGADLEAVVAEMAKMKEQYANPIFRLPMTFLEIFPVGLLITLLAAAVLRSSRFMPATPS